MTRLTLLQRRLDDITYPPTMRYEIESVRPLGVLRARLAVLERVSAAFFAPGVQLLDIGSSKGFFSFHAMTKGAESAVGIEPDPAAVSICQDVAHLKGYKAAFQNKTYRDFVCEPQFDRIFVGNAYHYLYGESAGWSFCSKLAANAKPGSLVLVEGPRDNTCPDLANPPPRGIWAQYPIGLRDAFNSRDFLAEMDRVGFRLIGEGAATEYTPGRWIWSFRKIPDHPEIALETCDGRVPVPRTYPGTKITIERTRDFTLKYYAGDPPDEFRSSQWQPRFAALPPGSTPIVAWLTRAGERVGWAEWTIPTPFFSHFRAGSALAAERRVLALNCVRGRFLASIGYVDVDLGSSNWAIESGARAVHCDKNSTWPVKFLAEPDELRKFLQTFRQSYSGVAFYEAELEYAARSASSRRMEQLYADLIGRLA